MRFATACTQCRSRRRKCKRAPGHGSCVSCVTTGARCSLATDARSAPRSLVCASEVQSLPERGHQVQEIVEDYIRFVHDRPHSLFHEPSLRQSVRDGTLPRALLFIICALGCSFSTNSKIKELKQTYLDASKSRLHDSLEELNIANLQTCILLANVFGTESQPIQEALYFSKSVSKRSVSLLRCVN